jgi:hypothetical protein
MVLVLVSIIAFGGTIIVIIAAAVLNMSMRGTISFLFVAVGIVDVVTKLTQYYVDAWFQRVRKMVFLGSWVVSVDVDIESNFGMFGTGCT